MLLAKHRIHQFVASTMRRWGFHSRVTLHNHTGEEVVATLLVRDHQGRTLKDAGPVARLANDRSAFFDVPALCGRIGLEAPMEHEYVLQFSLIPKRFEDATGPVEMEPRDALKLLTAQDHYIEHYDPETHFSSGVLYQTPPINDALYAPKSSFIMQAPKVFLTEQRNTAFQVLFHSSDPDYADTGRMLCRVRGADGTPLQSWSESFPAHGVRYLDVKEVLARHGHDWRRVVGRHGFLFFEAVSDTHSFIPITVNINQARRTFDMEHSLPPVYYGSKFGGPRKGQVIAALVESHQQPATAAPTRPA